MKTTRLRAVGPFPVGNGSEICAYVMCFFFGSDVGPVDEMSVRYEGRNFKIVLFFFYNFQEIDDQRSKTMQFIFTI